MKKLSSLFYKLSTGWLVIAILIVFTAFLIFVMPIFSARSAAFANGMDSPDTSVFYSGEALYQMAQGYGQAGRESFIDIRWTLDLLFPLVYTAFLVIAISWLLRKSTPRTSKLRLLNLVPLAGFVLDLLENSATSLVMLRFPTHAVIAEALAPIFTPLKWLAVLASFALLIILLIWWPLNRRLERSKKSEQ